MFRWCAALWRWLGSHTGKRTPPELPNYRRRFILVEEFVGHEDPPPMHWKACHTSTMRRFKAEMTCHAGHGLVLKGHTIAVDGTVFPSVVCMKPGCSFHEFIRLAGWRYGPLD